MNKKKYWSKARRLVSKCHGPRMFLIKMNTYYQLQVEIIKFDFLLPNPWGSLYLQNGWSLKAIEVYKGQKIYKGVAILEKIKWGSCNS